jgi:hypothetical protein
MAQCGDCGKTVSYAIRCNTTGNVARCIDCDHKAEQAKGIERPFDMDGSHMRVAMGFEPNVLEDGPIQMLPENWPGRYQEDGIYKVRLQSKEHEKDTLYAMGCHYGERGEKVGGHDLMMKGRPRVGSKSYSFIGNNRKASTCR